MYRGHQSLKIGCPKVEGSTEVIRLLYVVGYIKFYKIMQYLT